MLIGYARVSSQKQNLDRQIGGLRTAGCDKIFREKASGKSLTGRPQLEKAIDALGAGDVLVLAEWDRATRSMFDGIKIMQRVGDRGAALRVLDKPFLDMTDDVGRGVLALLSSLADDERKRMKARADAGRKAAKARGVHLGRKPKLSEHQVSVALQRLSDNDSCREIARDMGVHHSTISRLRE